MQSSPRAQKVSDAAAKVNLSIKAVDKTLLKGDDHVRWMKFSGNLEMSLEKIISGKDLREKMMKCGETKETLNY